MRQYPGARNAYLYAAIQTAETTSNRASRAKRNLAWEQIVLASHGFFAEELHKLARRFPGLSKTELQICALIKAGLSSRQIAQKFCSEEVTIERHRVRIRRKLRLDEKENLALYLIGA